MRRHIATAAVLAVIGAPSAALAERITPIGDIERGTNVTVTGTIERLLDHDEFRLADDSGAIRVYVGPNWIDADVGEQVTVRGFVDNDLLREIYARELVRADGSVVQFNHRYY